LGSFLPEETTAGLMSCKFIKWHLSIFEVYISLAVVHPRLEGGSQIYKYLLQYGNLIMAAI